MIHVDAMEYDDGFAYLTEVGALAVKPAPVGDGPAGTIWLLERRRIAVLWDGVGVRQDVSIPNTVADMLITVDSFKGRNVTASVKGRSVATTEEAAAVTVMAGHSAGLFAYGSPVRVSIGPRWYGVVVSPPDAAMVWRANVVGPQVPQ